MKTGTSRLHIFDKDYDLKEGDAVIIPPNTVHDHVKDSNDETCFMWWNFTYTLYDTIDVMRIQELPILCHVPHREKFEQVFVEYLNSARRTTKISDYIMQEAHAFEMVALLLEMALDSGSYKNMGLYPSNFVSMLNYINQNAHKNDLLKLLTKEYSMHPNYISRRFRKLYGVTPTQLQRHIRLQKAKALLLADISCSISEVALKLGYENVADFSRFFKNNCDISPLEYRKANISEGIMLEIK
jgi:AraC-like DNA-binding protein